VTQNSVGERERVIYTDAREKVSERRSGSHPSDKALPERRSGDFRYKIAPFLTKHMSPYTIKTESCCVRLW
jgi:hypothetical protein